MVEEKRFSQADETKHSWEASGAQIKQDCWHLRKSGPWYSWRSRHAWACPSNHSQEPWSFQVQWHDRSRYRHLARQHRRAPERIQLRLLRKPTLNRAKLRKEIRVAQQRWRLRRKNNVHRSSWKRKQRWRSWSHKVQNETRNEKGRSIKMVRSFPNHVRNCFWGCPFGTKSSPGRGTHHSFRWWVRLHDFWFKPKILICNINSIYEFYKLL